MGWLHAGLHPQRAESFCNLKLPHLAQSLHLGEVFLLERKSYESLSFPIVSNRMSSPFPAIRRLVLISRLVFTIQVDSRDALSFIVVKLHFEIQKRNSPP
jgi:hypothetical protein